MTDFIPHNHPQQLCIACAHMLDTCVGAYNTTAIPSPGDVLLCLHCGHPYKFDEKLTLAIIPDEEIEEIRLKDPECYMQMQRAIALIAARNKNN